jgi:acetyl-CoA carboxylase carboxyltransferase component
VMGPEPAVNAVYANRIAEITDPDERTAFIAAREAEYEEDVDLLRLASDLVIDAVVQPEDLRDEIVQRFRLAAGKSRFFSDRRHGVSPV